MGKKPIEIGLPDKFEFTDYGNFIRIVRKWFGPRIIYITFFTILWNFSIIIWYSDVLRSCLFAQGPTIFKIFFLFPGFKEAVGIYLTYYVIAGYLNKTIIHVVNSNIIVKHTPLPFFWGNKILNSSDIRQLYSKEKIGYNRHSNRISRYDLRAMTRDNKDVKLLRLDSPKQVLFVEQAIEKFLRIEDKYVKGEIDV